MIIIIFSFNVISQSYRFSEKFKVHSTEQRCGLRYSMAGTRWWWLLTRCRQLLTWHLKKYNYYNLITGQKFYHINNNNFLNYNQSQNQTMVIWDAHTVIFIFYLAHFLELLQVKLDLINWKFFWKYFYRQHALPAAKPTATVTQGNTVKENTKNQVWHNPNPNVVVDLRNNETRNNFWYVGRGGGYTGLHAVKVIEKLGLVKCYRVCDLT